MNILLTNDDGVESRGLQLLCGTLSAIKDVDVYVVAPDSERSAFSHAINFHREVGFLPLKRYFGAVMAFASHGTPADCVKFAVKNLNIPFDLVISGPNNGENYGHDILYSGTVGAAEEAVLCGMRAVALSRLGSSSDFSACVGFIKDNLHKLLRFDYTQSLLNINVPALPYNEVKDKVKVTAQGGALFDDYYQKADAEHHWILVGDKVFTDLDADCDVAWAERGYITVTPLTITQTDFDKMQKAKELFE